MALIEWRDAFRTGIASVDHEHAALIALLNQLHAAALAHAGAAALAGFLGDLHDAIAAHFALEEAVMQQIGYVGYVAHKADHERLLDEIRDIMEEQHAGADTTSDLGPRLEHWFMRHFHTEDAKLHAAEVRHDRR